MEHHPSRKRLRGKGYLSRLGPGIVSGAADDDPSGIATYSQVGAATGFRLVWGIVLLLPFAFAVQEACARLAIVTGQGLAGIIRTRLPRPVLKPSFFHTRPAFHAGHAPGAVSEDRLEPPRFLIVSTGRRGAFSLRPYFFSKE